MEYIKLKLKPDKFMGNPSQNYTGYCHMGSHNVTCRPTQTHPALTPASKAGSTRFTYPEAIEGRVD